MSPQYVLRTYLHAKDENRPHLLAAVFSRDAWLEIKNRSSEIAFPSTTRGLDAIGDVLVRRFNQSYENIYSFCMQRPEGALETFACDWLVGMSEKESRKVRVGCGGYEWTFQRDPIFLATRLAITIESMVVLDASSTAAVMNWLLGAGYPWASARVIDAAPPIAALTPVLTYLGRGGSGPRAS